MEMNILVFRREKINDFSEQDSFYFFVGARLLNKLFHQYLRIYYTMFVYTLWYDKTPFIFIIKKKQCLGLPKTYLVMLLDALS